ncbi:UPF0496 protein At4g34320-like [Macadamia integrifolia]|uniref:UPF0496 protein At4g34320-like n=1 Tax=Macadamia integrifolia TaxID=60698 RepID=UPI001C5310EA|nr:UPF0496 protein At4g34320-like [Macadamia integrifolia]
MMKNQELYELEVNYLNFLVSLEEGPRKAQEIQLIITNAHGRSEEEESRDIELFLTHLNLITLKEMSNKLQAINNKFHKKLKSTKRWRKASSMAFCVVSAVVPITSMIAPPFVAAILQSILASFGKWVDSFWKRKENTLKEQKKLIRLMDLKNHVVMQDLGYTNQLVNEKHEWLLKIADLAVIEKETVEKLVGFQNAIGGLCKQAEKCYSNIGNARREFLRSIIEDQYK